MDTTTRSTIDELIPPPSVSDRLGVPESTLAQWRYLGKGPAYVKVGRHVRYRQSDIEHWLDAQTCGGGAI